MSVVRINKTSNYTVMSNYHLRDMNLSLKAKGLLSMMLSLPEDWDYSVSGLCSICKEKETAIKAALNELKDCGYLVVTKKYPNETSSGKIEYIYDIFEQPQDANNQGIENLCVENQGQINIDNKIKNINNNSAPEPHECDFTDDVLKKAEYICNQELHLGNNVGKEVVKTIKSIILINTSNIQDVLILTYQVVSCTVLLKLLYVLQKGVMI